MDLGPRIVSEKMSLPFRIILLVTSLTLLSTIVLCQKSQIRIDPDGGYTGIVIKIDKDVPEDLCPEILTNLKVRKLCLPFHCFFRQCSLYIPIYCTMVIRVVEFSREWYRIRKMFAFKIYVLKENYWISRIGVGDSCQNWASFLW